MTWAVTMRNISLFLTIFLSSTLVSADSVKPDSGNSYNFADISYLSATLKNNEYTGYTLKGSYLLTENIFIPVGYRNLSRSGNADIELTKLGLGYKISVGSNTDLYSSLSYLSQKITTAQNGYNFTVGLRSKLMDKLEIDANAYHNDVGSIYSNDLVLSAKYLLNDKFYLTIGTQQVSGSSTGHINTIGIGAKFWFVHSSLTILNHSLGRVNL